MQIYTNNNIIKDLKTKLSPDQFKMFSNICVDVYIRIKSHEQTMMNIRRDENTIVLVVEWVLDGCLIIMGSMEIQTTMTSELAIFKKWIPRYF